MEQQTQNGSVVSFTIPLNHWIITLQNTNINLIVAKNEDYQLCNF